MATPIAIGRLARNQRRNECPGPGGKLLGVGGPHLAGVGVTQGG